MNNESPFIIHFRITTHGGTRVENNHPFKVDKDTVFVHNGIINSVVKFAVGHESDTRSFNRNILRNLPKGWKSNNAVKFMIEDFIGTSKLIMLHTDYSVDIYNQNMGTWEDGVWYSNTTFRRYGTGYSYGQSSHRGTWKNGKWTYDDDKKEKKKDKRIVKKFDATKKGAANNEIIVYSSKSTLKAFRDEKGEVHIQRQCDVCGDYFSVRTLEYYKLDDGEAEAYCEHCSDFMQKNSIIKRTDEIRYSEYLDILDECFEEEKEYGSRLSKGGTA